MTSSPFPTFFVWTVFRLRARRCRCLEVLHRASTVCVVLVCKCHFGVDTWYSGILESVAIGRVPPISALRVFVGAACWLAPGPKTCPGSTGGISSLGTPPWSYGLLRRPRIALVNSSLDMKAFCRCNPATRYPTPSC